MKKLPVFLTLFAALCLTAGSVCCKQARAQPFGPHGFFRMHGPGAIFGDAQHLYVTAGGKLLEYKLDGMTLEHSVDLPACAPPRRGHEAMRHGPFPPMSPPPPPSRLWAGNGKLYVLAGPAVYVYKTPALTLEKTVMLPGPKPPQAGERRAP